MDEKGHSLSWTTNQGNIWNSIKRSRKCGRVDPIADLPPELIEKGKSVALQAYCAAECSGMARVDTFLDKDGNFWLNEINTIPGFTEKSLFPSICRANGLSEAALIDRLLILALQRKSRHHDSPFAK